MEKPRHCTVTSLPLLLHDMSLPRWFNMRDQIMDISGASIGSTSFPIQNKLDVINIQIFEK